MIFDVSGVMPGGGAPGGGDGLAGELEWGGALDGAGGAVAGLACAEDLAGVLDRDLDAPPGGIPLDDLGEAGAGVRGGAVYGETDKIVAYVKDKPVRPQDFSATIYHALGVPFESRVTRDGRSQPLSTGQPLLDLFG